MGAGLGVGIPHAVGLTLGHGSLGVGLQCSYQPWKQAEATVGVFLSPKRNIEVQILLCKMGCFLMKEHAPS